MHSGRPGVSSDSAVYDPNALALGRAVQAETGAEEVILFGSRARGDYREDSDIDLLLIHSTSKDNELRAKVNEKAKAAAVGLYGIPVGVDLVWFTREEFDRMRRSHNHVTAIVAEEGVSMEGEPASLQHGDDGEYSYEWTLTSQRCRHAKAHLRSTRRSIEYQEIDIITGQHAQQALEHAMKGLISAGGRRYPRHHELVDLERRMRLADPEFTQPMESPLSALNDYGGGLRYEEPYAPLGDHDELLRKVESDVQRIFQRIGSLTGRDPWQDDY